MFELLPPDQAAFSVEPLSFEETLAKLENNEWQLKHLRCEDSVRLSAHTVASCLHYLKQLKSK